MVTCDLSHVPSPSGRVRAGLLFVAEQVELAGDFVYNLLKRFRSVT